MVAGTTTLDESRSSNPPPLSVAASISSLKRTVGLVSTPAFVAPSVGVSETMVGAVKSGVTGRFMSVWTSDCVSARL
jgi:hypothetical protein